MVISLTIKIVLLFIAFFIGRFIREQESTGIKANCVISTSSKIITTTTNAEVKCPIISSSNCSSLPYITLQSYMHRIPPTIPEDLFYNLHHPSTPAKNALLYSWTNDSPNTTSLNDPSSYLSQCNEVFLTRTGSRANQPNKCVAVIKSSVETISYYQIAHRIGVTALTLNQYQKDFPRDESLSEENQLLPQIILNLNQLKQQLIDKVGNPIDPLTNERRNVVVMVANEGVIDLVLNFLCSLESIDFDVKNIIIFIGDLKYEPLITNFGNICSYLR